jgi:hypothetical protein
VISRLDSRSRKEDHVLTGLGWLDLATLQRWQQGRLPSLEAGIQTSPAKVTAAMELFRSWASERGLRASETDYVARNPANDRSTSLVDRLAGADAAFEDRGSGSTLLRTELVTERAHGLALRREVEE